MALIKCPECKNVVSSEAVSCPHCGFPIAGRVKVAPNPRANTNTVKDEVIAERTNGRGVHVLIYVLSPIFIVIGGVLEILSFVQFYNGRIPLGIFLLLFSQFFEFIGIFFLIFLGCLKGKNARIKKDLIYFSHATQAFTFYDIDGRTHTLNKDDYFRLRDNFRNTSELLLFIKGKKINLGYTSTPIKEIRSKISKIKGVDCSKEIR